MSALSYFLIWAVIIFLMMRFGCGAHVMGHGHGKIKHGGGDHEVKQAVGFGAGGFVYGRGDTSRGGGGGG